MVISKQVSPDTVFLARTVEVKVLKINDILYDGDFILKMKDGSVKYLILSKGEVVSLNSFQHEGDFYVAFGGIWLENIEEMDKNEVGYTEIMNAFPEIKSISYAV